MTLDRRRFLKIAGAHAGLLAAGCAAPSAAVRAGTVPRSSAPSVGGASPDVVVIGAGAFGGWTAYNLVRMGARVTLVDAFGPGNSRSTSGDETRGVRSSYGDRPHGDQWMRWANEAIQRWRAWDEEHGRAQGMPLFYQTGDLIMRSDWSSYLTDTKKLWDEQGIPNAVLSSAEVNYRYPVIGLEDIGVALYEPGAGVVRARRACESVATVFRALGGRLVIGRVQTSLAANGELTELRLSTGETLRADSYVFAVGPWMWKMFPVLLERRMRTPLGHVYYFGTPPGDERFTHPNLPSFSFPGITGWPALGEDNRGFRVRTGGGPHGDPDESQRWIEGERHERPRNFLADRFPLLENAPILETRACHYELTVTRNFIIDRHPEMPNVWLAGGGSAEGFKFGPVVGEYIASRVLGNEGDPELASSFKLSPEQFEEAPPPAPVPVPADTAGTAGVLGE
ncbi:MAG TPA: FAD-dependent oxidoreductase [Gemmatimonadaceae bacterium]|nr:FAD-dependent oxidoreductase [Gemmatimonadaceae bacterium]